jgi:hypothetical protein
VVLQSSFNTLFNQRTLITWRTSEFYASSRNSRDSRWLGNGRNNVRSSCGYLHPSSTTDQLSGRQLTFAQRKDKELDKELEAQRQRGVLVVMGKWPGRTCLESYGWRILATEGLEADSNVSRHESDLINVNLSLGNPHASRALPLPFYQKDNNVRLRLGQPSQPTYCYPHCGKTEAAFRRRSLSNTTVLGSC